MPSLIEILLALLIVVLFFITVVGIGFTLVALQNDEEPYYDEDVFIQANDFSEFYPQSEEDERRAHERDWL